MAAPFCLMAFTEESYQKESVNFISECQEMNIQTDVIELLHEISEIGLGDATTQKKLNTLAASDNFKDFIVFLEDFKDFGGFLRFRRIFGDLGGFGRI